MSGMRSSQGMAPVPFHDDGQVTLYNGDAVDVLPHVGPADVTITDPPYNVGKNYGDGHSDRLAPEAYQAWLRSILALCDTPEVLLFPGTANAFDVREVLPDGLRPYRILGWHKREFAGDKWNGGPAMCWEPIVWATRREEPGFVKRFGVLGRDFYVVNETKGDPFKGPHPCPKPMPVMRWLVGLFVPEGGTVLDPFSGSGATLAAARELDRNAIGVELNPDYCALTMRRFDQGVLAA